MKVINSKGLKRVLAGKRWPHLPPSAAPAGAARASGPIETGDRPADYRVGIGVPLR